MSLEVIVPKDAEAWLNLRAQDITSTEVAALFGLSPYMTLYELWHRKKAAQVVKLEPNERMVWGNRLQEPIARGFASDFNLAIRSMPEYMRDTELRMGSSFDYRILSIATAQLAAGVKPGDEINAKDSVNDGLLEVKNVDSLAFRDGWAEDDNGVEAPPHIELQVQHQLALSGLKFARIGALVGGNKLVPIERVRSEEIISSIKEKIAQFWKAIAMNAEPKPDFERDAEFITKLHNFAEPGKEIDIAADEEALALATEYKKLGDAAKAAELARDAIKAQLLMKIGDAEKALAPGFSITAGIVGPARVEYDREPYRNFRINWKKAKRA